MSEDRKDGFTLTEVIVVIVIIAALAIILIPNMLSLMPDDHNIKYKKAFYTIQEVVNDITNDCQGLHWNTTDNEWKNAANPNNVLHYCYDTTVDPPQKKYLADEICERMSTTTDCTTIKASHSGSFQTTNGMYWYIPMAKLASDSDKTEAMDTATIYVNVDNKTFSGTPSATNADNGIYRIMVSKNAKVTTPGTPESNLLLDNPTKD